MNKKPAYSRTPKETKTIVFYVLILMVCFALYGFSIKNDFNIDDDYVYENHPLVQQGIKGIPEIFTSRYNTRDEQYFGYRPLTIAIYAVEFEVFGSNPHSAHFLNIVYYTVCCWLLFYFLSLIFKPIYNDNYIWLSFLITLLFATHAIHTEVVLSIKNREEIVSLILGLTSLIWALKYFSTKKILWLFVSVASLALAFLAKESAIVFIILIPVTIIFFKTDIKFLTASQINLDSIKPKQSYEKILYPAFFICIVMFVLLSKEIKIGFGFNIVLREFKTRLNEYFAWGTFIIIYLILLFFRKRSGNPIQPTKVNLTLWATTILLIILIPILKSSLATIVSFLTLLLTLKSKNEDSYPLIKFKLIENKSTKILLAVAAFLAISSIVLALSYYIPKQSMPETNAPVFKWQNPAFAQGANFSNKVAIALYSLIYYTKLMFLPFPLRFYYGYKMIPEVGIFNPFVLVSLVLNMFLLIWSLRGFNKRNVIAYGFLFWFISIFPLANTFFPLTGIIAERLLFIPSIGFSIILTFLIFKISKTELTVKLTKRHKYVSLAIAMIIILPNSIITLNRNKDWKDRKILFSHDIQYLENSAKANVLYGNLLIGEVFDAVKKNKPIGPMRSQIDEAVKHFNKAVEIDSTYSNPWHSLGYINMIIFKNYPLAQKQFTSCISSDSTIAAAYLNRGITNYYLKNYVQSITDFKDYITKNRNYKDKEYDKAYLFSAKSYLEMGDTAKATQYYVLAKDNLKKQNLNPAVIQDIKKYFITVKDFKNAISISDLEISLNPKSDVPYVEKGNYYLLAGDTLSAIQNWEIAFEKFNGNYNIGITISNYYRGKGNLEKANYYYNAAVDYRNKNPKQAAK